MRTIYENPAANFQHNSGRVQKKQYTFALIREPYQFLIIIYDSY